MPIDAGASRLGWIRPLLALLAAGAVAGSGRPASAESYAFLVGVSDYSKSELKRLNYACEDVIAFADVLRAGGFAERNIVLMHNKRSDSKFLPEKYKILSKLHLLMETLTPEDTLIVAFAGHGVQFEGEGVNYFCPLDTSIRDRSTLIDLKAIYDEMEGCPAKRKLLLVDACRNDPESELARGSGVMIQSATKMATEDVPRGIAAVFSCREEQRSYEDPALRHGVFFHHVIKAWKGDSDADGDGRVLLEELFNYVKQETRAYAFEKLEQPQTPILRDEAQLGKAWILTESVRKEGQDDPLALFLQGESLRRSGQLAQAEKEYKAALRVDPNFVRAHLGLGKVYEGLGMSEPAIEAFSQAIRLEPDNPVAYLCRGGSYARGENYRSALADYTKAAGLDPKQVAAHVGRGAALERLGSFDEAIRALTEAVGLDPRNAIAHYNLGVARTSAGDATRAEEAFRKAFELDKGLETAP